jgi:hypothetical protein
MEPGLKPALHVHRGCWWIDPPGGHKGQRGHQPDKYHTCQEAYGKAAERELANMELEMWQGWHSSG